MNRVIHLFFISFSDRIPNAVQVQETKRILIQVPINRHVPFATNTGNKTPTGKS